MLLTSIKRKNINHYNFCGLPVSLKSGGLEANVNQKNCYVPTRGFY